MPNSLDKSVSKAWLVLVSLGLFVSLCLTLSLLCFRSMQIRSNELLEMQAEDRQKKYVNTLMRQIEEDRTQSAQRLAAMQGEIGRAKEDARGAEERVAALRQEAEAARRKAIALEAEVARLKEQLNQDGR